MHISVIQAILLGTFYWITTLGAGYTLQWFSCLVAGVVSGLILGDIRQGAMIGAVIQPMFLAFTGGGGTVVWDPVAGTIAGSAITMVGGLPLDQALTIAVPVSLLFAQLSTVRRIFFAYPAAKADQAALKGNDRAIVFYGSWFCWISKVVLYGLPMTLSIYVGAEAVGNLLSNLPDWITNALSAVGGVLPALGIAMTVRVIGRPLFWPFFLGGFFLVQYTSIGGLFLAFIGLFFAFLYYLIATSNAQAGENGADESEAGSAALNADTKRLLTKNDCHTMWLRWWWYCEQSNSFARLQSIAFCCAFIPALKKLYGNDPGEYSAALTRHLMFFNTQGVWGSVTHGIVLAMEEQRAMGAAIDVSAITGIKAGLMGPFAGIGDTIDWATFAPLVAMLFIPLARTGSPLGAVAFFVIVSGVTFTEGYIYSYTGYRLGTSAAVTILQGRRINVFIATAGVLGLFMMGGLAASFVSVVTPLYIPTSGTPMLVQSGILNAIAPGILPLAVILFTYSYIQRGNSMSKAALVLTGLGLALGAIGLIGGGGLIFPAYVAPAA